MGAARGDVAGAGGAEAPRGRTPWGVVTAILGLPAPAACAFPLMTAVRVLLP
ncbi:hypothetical protein [Streptomyces werraensis]|uniref:hypothetical protein n=1 Tax=Streptomyces werraensis TaxID=68284 RepID=UPI001CE326DF